MGEDEANDSLAIVFRHLVAACTGDQYQDDTRRVYGFFACVLFLRCCSCLTPRARRPPAPTAEE